MAMGGTMMKIILVVAILAALAYIILPRMWDYGKTVLGWTSDEEGKEVDPNLVTLLKIDPAGEILNFKNYELWIGSEQTVKPQEGFSTLKLTFDKDLTAKQVMDAIEVYEENCNGYESTFDPTGMGSLVNTCLGHPDSQLGYALVQNMPIQYAMGYMSPDNKKKFYFQVQGYDGQDFLIRFKREYIEGYCGNSCKGLDAKGHRLNPNTVAIRFQT